MEEICGMDFLGLFCNNPGRNGKYSLKDEERSATSTED